MEFSIKHHKIFLNIKMEHWDLTRWELWHSEHKGRLIRIALDLKPQVLNLVFNRIKGVYQAVKGMDSENEKP